LVRHAEDVPWPTVPVPDDREVPPREVVRDGLRLLSRRLATGDYEGLCADGSAYRQRPEWLRSAVQQYGRTLTELPDEAFELMEFGAITARPGLFWLVQPLWTVEEGRSDLDLIGGVAREVGGWRVYLDDLRVQ
jgi:hypothetical protein